MQTNIHCFIFLVQLGETNTTRRLVDNPNNLVADFQKNRFKYFSEIEVRNAMIDLCAAFVFIKNYSFS